MAHRFRYPHVAYDALYARYDRLVGCELYQELLEIYKYREISLYPIHRIAKIHE